MLSRALVEIFNRPEVAERFDDTRVDTLFLALLGVQARDQSRFAQRDFDPRIDGLVTDADTEDEGVGGGGLADAEMVRSPILVYVGSDMSPLRRHIGTSQDFVLDSGTVIHFKAQSSPLGSRMGSKINQLLQEWPTHAVGTVRWLNSKGVDRRLADKYVKSGWLKRLGHGAYVRAGSTVDWPGGVQTLQTQLEFDIHPGGITAIELRGYAHYLALGGREVILFGKPGTKLPTWFAAHPWSQPVTLVTTNVFAQPNKAGSTVKFEGVELEVATLEQATFEMMYLVPKRQSYEESLQVMESLTSLRPHVVQRLLENCTSVKTKRLFMHAAERLNHAWLSRLDLSNVDFGSGRRTIHAGGRLDKKYNLVVADPVQG